MSQRLTTWAKVALVQVTIVVLGLALIEIFFRVAIPLPVQGGIYLDASGAPVRVAQNEVQLRANARVTHVASEFSKTIETNGLGYRAIDNESRAPDFIFLGDSFAFGHGVSNEEVAAFLFCTRTKVVCQNLARSGTNTFDQVRILEYALTQQKLRPKHVVLVMFASCWLGGSGNDLGDNQRHLLRNGQASLLERVLALAHRMLVAFASEAKADEPGGEPTPPSDEARRRPFWRRMQSALAEFQIVRRAMLVFSPAIKRQAFACSPDRDLAAAMGATRTALEKLQALASRYGFRVTVFSVHPYQELGGAHLTTERYVRSVLPEGFAYFPTAEWFNEGDYYPYDGHLNARGNAVLASIFERHLR